MPTSSVRTMIVGTVEYLDIPITADTELTTQPVAISLDDATTWLTATWTGDAGATRTASVLLGADNPLPAVGQYRILVKITDNPEAPIIDAGRLQVIAA